MLDALRHKGLTTRTSPLKAKEMTPGDVGDSKPRKVTCCSDRVWLLRFPSQWHAVEGRASDSGYPG
jgi:hypothetical protein